MVSGVNDVVRVNGTAKITTTKNVLMSFEHEGHIPVCVLIIKVTEVHIHCPKSMMRSDFWNTKKPSNVPTIGSILKEVTTNEVGDADFDKDLSERTKKRCGLSRWRRSRSQVGQTTSQKITPPFSQQG